MKKLACFMIALNIYCLNAQDSKHIKKQVLEFIVNSWVNHDGRIYLRYAGNQSLKNYLEKNKVSLEEDLSFHRLRQFLSEDEIRAILNEKQVSHFIKQLQSPKEEIIYSLDLINPSIGYTPIVEVKKNFEIGVPLDTDIYYLNISEPIISLNKKQVLVNVSRGFTGAYSGGILLFQIDNKGIRPKANINPWIE